MKTLKTDITIPTLKGKKTIAQSKIFSYLDSDFVNYGTDKPGRKTDAMKVAVCETTENATFKQLFTNPEAMAMSQEQILFFLKNHKDELNQDWYNFFLFKAGSEFFVAGVGVIVSCLGVRARRLDDGSVWCAEDQRRVVVPQLALESQSSAPSILETLTPSPEAAIKVVKEAGYKVVKEL